MVSGLYAPRSTAFDKLPIEHRAALASAVLLALGGRGRRLPIANASPIAFAGDERYGGSERRGGGDRRNDSDRRDERRTPIERRHGDDRRDLDRFSYNPPSPRRGTARPDESPRRPTGRPGPHDSEIN